MEKPKKIINDIPATNYLLSGNTSRAIVKLIKLYQDVVEQLKEFYNVLQTVRDGETPQIINDYWYIKGENTGVKAVGLNGEKGEQGIQGPQGEQGIPGNNGITPLFRINETTLEWEISYDNATTWKSTGVIAKGDIGPKGEQGEQGVTGEKGDRGEQGIQGEKGAKGDKGDIGATGESAYELAVRLGYEGSESDWIKSFATYGQEALNTIETLFGFNYYFSFTDANFTNGWYNITGKKINNQYQLTDCPILYLGSTNTAASSAQEGTKNTNGYRPTRTTILRITNVYPGTIIEYTITGVNDETFATWLNNIELTNTISEKSGSSTIYTHTCVVTSKEDCSITLLNTNYTYSRSIKIYSNNPVFLYRNEASDFITKSGLNDTLADYLKVEDFDTQSQTSINQITAIKNTDVSAAGNVKIPITNKETIGSLTLTEFNKLIKTYIYNTFNELSVNDVNAIIGAKSSGILGYISIDNLKTKLTQE